MCVRERVFIDRVYICDDESEGVLMRVVPCTTVLRGEFKCTLLRADTKAGQESAFAEL